MHFSCSQTLYGVVAGSRALVTIDTTTGALRDVCTLTLRIASDAATRVIALFDDTRLVHFVGSASPTMELLSLTNLGVTTCNAVAVAAYRAAASVFAGSPVLAAQRDVFTATARVLVVAGSPARLWAVTAAGDITLLASLLSAHASEVVSPYALSVTGASTTVCGIAPGECLSHS
jgi:hypothetical protein